ncbi:MAG: zinc ribbon domain-containing protein [Gemmatimonadetes bacterium]|nr:zinc ribbon domain-containing protein [Gemmatimonadota bacterium]
MPTYDYVCKDCGREFSRVESMAKHRRAPEACPACHSRNTERVFTSFYAKTIRKS